jgi:hypothetical protein
MAIYLVACTVVPVGAVAAVAAAGASPATVMIISIAALALIVLAGTHSADHGGALFDLDGDGGDSGD